MKKQKILPINLSRLRNDETHYLGFEILKQKSNYSMPELLLETSFTSLEANNNQLSVSLKKLPTKRATSIINAIKKECINSYRVFYTYTKALKGDKDHPNKAEIELVSAVFNANKKPLLKMNNSTLHTVMNTLLKAFAESDGVLAAITTINADSMYTRMGLKTETLRTEMENRNELIGSKAELTATEAAEVVHKSCSNLFDFLDVMQTQNPRTEYAELITIINALITDLNNSISHRGGSDDNDNEDDSPETPTGEV